MINKNNALSRVGQHWPQFAIVLLGLLFLVWSALFIQQSSVVVGGQRYYSLYDDAMITMRYATNFVEGRGLVWNEGERVEGYTNFFMLLVMAVPTLLFDPITTVLVVQVLGALIVLGIAYGTWRIFNLLAQRYGVTQRWLGVVVFAACLGYYPLNFWSLLGMETGLLALLLVGAVYFLLRSEDPQQPRWITAILLGLMFWTRPDALIYAGIIYLYRLWTLPNKRHLRVIFLEWGIVLAFVLSLTGFRLWYYGQIVPNTYILKIDGIPLDFRLHDGFTFIYTFFVQSGLVPLVVLTVMMWFMSKRSELMMLMGLLGVVMVYQIWTGGDFIFYWRILATPVPLFIAAVVLVWAQVRGWMNLIVLPMLIIQLNYGFWSEFALREMHFDIKSNVTNIRTALAINEALKPGSTIGVLLAGTLPYYDIEMHAYDYLGKSDPYIARLAPDLSGSVSWGGLKSVTGHNKYDLEYSVRGLNPDYTQTFTWGNQTIEPYTTLYRRFAVGEAAIYLRIDSDNVRWDVVCPTSHRWRESCRDRQIFVLLQTLFGWDKQPE